MNHFIATAWIARPVLLFGFCAGLAIAQASSADYKFLFGFGFLCDGNDASTWPAMGRPFNATATRSWHEAIIR